MTELAGGETALSTAVLVLTGLASLGYVPGVVTLAAGASVDVAASVIVVQLLVAVVAPMALAVGARTRFPGPVSRYDAVYPSISAVMVVLIISGVTAANAGVIRSAGAALLPVGLGAVTLNGVGYLLEWIGGARRARPERIAVTLSVGTRDFAVAAALIVAAGLPTIASLPAVTFGVVEMATSAGLARYFARDRLNRRPSSVPEGRPEKRTELVRAERPANESGFYGVRPRCRSRRRESSREPRLRSPTRR